MEKLYFTYNQIHSTMKDLADKLAKDNHKFDAIVTIASGGFIPARILKTYLSLPIYVIYMSLYSDETHQMIESVKNQIPVFSHPDSDITGKNILLLDEIDDTRTTLDICSKFLQNKKPAKLVVASMHNKLVVKSGFIDSSLPYYTGTDVENKWIVYPWELLDINEIK